VEKLDASFEVLPGLKHDSIGYRGRINNHMFKCPPDFGIVQNAKVGDIIILDSGCPYYGFERTLADHWGGNSENWCGDVNVMTIETIFRKGAKVSRNTEHGGEIVTPRNARYKVLDKTVNEHGDIDLKLEYIGPLKG